MIVKMAVFVTPNSAPPVALVSTNRMSSGPSTSRSFRIVTRTVLLVSPGRNCTTTLLTTKSRSAVAVTPTVRKSTVFVPIEPPVRRMVMSMPPAASFTVFVWKVKLKLP